MANGDESTQEAQAAQVSQTPAPQPVVRAPDTQTSQQQNLQVADDAPLTTRNVINAVNDTAANKDELEDVSRLIDESGAFFGHPSYVAAGAFSPLAEHGVTQLTRKQAQAVLEAWLGSETNPPPPEE